LLSLEVPNNAPALLSGLFDGFPPLLSPLAISTNERSFPFRELPGIYGILVNGLRTTKLSGPPIFKAAFVPPICKPVFKMIDPV